MSDYGHDDAMRDLEGIALKETHTARGRHLRMEEYRRLAAYIARLEGKPADPMAEAYLASERIEAQSEWAAGGYAATDKTIAETLAALPPCHFLGYCMGRVKLNATLQAKYDQLLAAARINAADRTRLAATSPKHRRKQLTVVEAGSFKNLCAATAEAKGETPPHYHEFVFMYEDAARMYYRCRCGLERDYSPGHVLPAHYSSAAPTGGTS